MAIIITAAVILHHGSQYYHSPQHGIYQLTEVKSKSVSLWQVGPSLTIISRLQEHLYCP